MNLLPSDLSSKPKAVEMPETEYKFPEQVRNHPISAAWTGGTIQTYDYKGEPWDSQGDNYD